MKVSELLLWNNKYEQMCDIMSKEKSYLECFECKIQSDHSRSVNDLLLWLILFQTCKRKCAKLGQIELLDNSTRLFLQTTYSLSDLLNILVSFTQFNFS